MGTPIAIDAVQITETRASTSPFYVRQLVVAPCGLCTVMSTRQNKSDTPARGKWMVEVRPEKASDTGRSCPIETYFADECETAPPINRIFEAHQAQHSEYAEEQQ